MADAVIEYYQSFSKISNEPTISHQNLPSGIYKHQNRDQYYNLESSYPPQIKRFSCKICNKDFFTHGMYKKHMNDHVNCPFPECNFKASLKMIDTHITHQHMLINFDDLQIDDETWINERKKRFPSMQRAELRRNQQIERLKRGERLGKNNNKFPKERYNHASQSSSESKDRSTEKSGKRQRHRKPFSKVCKPDYMDYTSDVSNESDSEIKQGIHRFKGINDLLESTGEIPLFRLNASNKIMECDKEVIISDEEDWNDVPSSSTSFQNTNVNPLASLLGAYNSDSDDSEKGMTDEMEPSTEVLVAQMKADDMLNDSLNKMKNIVKEPNEREQDIFDEPLKKKKKVDSEETLDDKPSKRLQKSQKGHPAKFNKKRASQKQHFKGRKPTLLEKLLEPEIVHERNIILQCIRYIVQNNFFDSDK